MAFSAFSLRPRFVPDSGRNFRLRPGDGGVLSSRRREVKETATDLGERHNSSSCI